MSIRHASDGDNALIDQLNLLVDDVNEFLTNGWNLMLTQLDGDATLSDADYNSLLAVTSAAVGLVRSGNRPNTLKTLVAPGATRGASSLAATVTRRTFGSHGDGALQTEVNAVQAAVQSLGDNFPTFIAKLEADSAASDYDPTLPAAATSAPAQRGVSTAADPSELGGTGGAGANARQPEGSGTRQVDPNSGARQFHVDADDTFLAIVNECRADLVALLGVTGAPGTGLIGVLELLDADAGVAETDYEANNTPAAATQTEDLVRDGDHPNSSNL